MFVQTKKWNASASRRTRKVIRKIFRYGERLWEERLQERENRRRKRARASEKGREGAEERGERADRKDRRHIGIKVAVNAAR